jgi:hypothetical protein
MAPFFSKLIPIKLNNNKIINIMGYDIIVKKNINDCKIYSKFQIFKYKYLYDTGHINFIEFQQLKKCNNQWLKDYQHAAIVLKIYNTEEAQLNVESNHFITKRPKEIFNVKTKSCKIPKEVQKDFYVVIEGSVTDININDFDSSYLNLDLTSEPLTFDENKGYYVGSDGKQWTNLTKESVNLAVFTIINKFREESQIIKYDDTDNLYIQEIIFKNNLLKEDFSQKSPEQIDALINDIENNLKVPTFIINQA